MTAMYLPVKASDRFVEVSGAVSTRSPDRPCDPGTSHRRLVPHTTRPATGRPERKERP
jgi:hypothetical protein